MIDINKLEQEIISGNNITREQALELFELEDEAKLQALYKVANNIREHYMGNKIDLCTIMNAKSGKCSENCKYCAQSAHYETEASVYPLISKEKALERALENASYGVNHFSLVTSGKGLDGNDFEQILDIFSTIKRETPKLKLCASLGIISAIQARALKEVGVTTYHHNIETSRSFYSEICTTHSYQDRIDTIKNMQNVGISVCSGGIIGLGESYTDRVDMALELRDLDITSVPINVLNPVKGTPLQDNDILEPVEILKTMAIFRLILPKAYIRYAGGRLALKDKQELGFQAGVNAALVGNYLTTIGNNIQEDIDMVERLGFEIN